VELVLAAPYAAQINEETGGIMLKVHTRKSEAVEVLSLEGQLVNGNTEILRGLVDSGSATTDMILDLSNVSVVDAHGLGVLLQLREQTLAKGVHFELINVSDPLYRVFEITRLNTVFEINSHTQFLPEIVRNPPVLVAA
jgi:anti-anti-sigma factor